MSYKLLTPGPLTTTKTVKEQMLVDHCTWDDDYKQITQSIRKSLLAIAGVSEEAYTAILMQGSGTFGVESVLSSVIAADDQLLIITNGAYGERIAEMASVHGINHVVYATAVDQQADSEAIEKLLQEQPGISHIAMVHCETTTGILNELAPISSLCQTYNKTFIVDAMSSFGGVPIDMAGLNIDFLISSANKCIQGVPGFSFIIANRHSLEASRGNSRTLSLDLHSQWDTMAQDGKWRFTSPTHTVLAFAQALKELAAEGGVSARQVRFRDNMTRLRSLFSAIGLVPLLTEENQSPIIATFHYPSEHFDFKAMYDFVKARGYAIYPGKLLGMATFRIGVIGEIYPEDIQALAEIMSAYFEA